MVRAVIFLSLLFCRGVVYDGSMNDSKQATSPTQLEDKIDMIIRTMDLRFGKMDEHFEDIDKCFDRIDMRFDRIEKRQDDAEGLINFQNGKYDHIMNTVDGFMGRINHYEIESAARDHQVPRHEKWIKKFATKSGEVFA